MALSTLVRLFWVATHASIPPNWGRDTAFDDRFIQGGGSGFLAAANGGLSSHTHMIPAHDQDSAATHFHRITSGAASGEATVQTLLGSVQGVTKFGHRHAGFNVADASIHYQTKAAEVSSGQASLPPYVQAIVISPDDAAQEIPVSAVCFAEAAAPAGFAAEVALDGHFLLGAPTGSGDGGAFGGSLTHTHGMPAGHTHTPDPHPHQATTVGNAQTGGTASGSGRVVPVLAHHDVSLGPVASNTTDSTSATSGEGSSEPEYVKLLAIKNTSGSPTTPDGVVVGFVGAVADIPVGYVLMDGTGSSSTDCLDKQIKCTKTVGEIGDTGGSATHTHSFAHSHTVTGNHAGHTPTAVDLAGSSLIPIGSGVTVTQTSAHAHTWTVGAKAEGDTDVVVLFGDLVDGREPFRTMIFIKNVPVPVPRPRTAPPATATLPPPIQLITQVKLMPGPVVPTSEVLEVDEDSIPFAPFNLQHWQYSIGFDDLPEPTGDVTITIKAKASLADPTRVGVDLNGNDLLRVAQPNGEDFGRLFKGPDFFNCPVVPDVEQRFLPRSTWIKMVPDGNAVIRVFMFNTPDSIPTCVDSFVQIFVAFSAGAQPPPPSYLAWVSVDQILLDDGKNGRINCELAFDDVVGALVGEIHSTRLRKIGRAGLAIRKVGGASALVLVGPYEKRGNVLRVSSAGSCPEL